MKTWQKYLLVCNTVLILIGAYFMIDGKIAEKKFAYVELNKVFESFKYKKQSETEYNNYINSKQRVLDSLEADLIGAQNDNDKNRIEMVKTEYFKKQQEFETESESISKDVSNKIWLQLTQYMNDFSKERGITILLGGNGDGSLMYADEALNVTEDVIKYVNIRYDGKDK